MSKRKPAPHMPPEDRAVAGVRAIAEHWPFVASISDHFAGYFNELGITLAISSDARDEDLIALQNELLAYLDNFWTQEKPPFTWMIMFSDGTRTMVPLVLGDGPRSSSDDLRV